MTRILLAILLVGWAGAGCQFSKPVRDPDSLDNATARTWSVTADFASGLRHQYDQGPESFSNYGTRARNGVPLLTNLVVVAQEPESTRYSLSARDILKLRRAVPGKLMLVLYDEGIASLSPELTKHFEREVLKHPYTQKEYFRLLREQKAAALSWTRKVLGHGPGAGSTP